MQLHCSVLETQFGTFGLSRESGPSSESQKLKRQRVRPSLVLRPDGPGKAKAACSTAGLHGEQARDSRWTPAQGPWSRTASPAQFPKRAALPPGSIRPATPSEKGGAAPRTRAPRVAPAFLTLAAFLPPREGKESRSSACASAPAAERPLGRKSERRRRLCGDFISDRGEGSPVCRLAGLPRAPPPRRSPATPPRRPEPPCGAE